MCVVQYPYTLVKNACTLDLSCRSVSLRKFFVDRPETVNKHFSRRATVLQLPGSIKKKNCQTGV